MTKTFWLLSKISWAIAFKFQLFPLGRLRSKLKLILTVLLWQFCLKRIKARA